MQRVIFRADGNLKIGLGHIYRSLALAEMLKKSFKILFFVREPISEIRKIILQTCSECINLSKGAKEFTEYLQKNDIVVLDGYHFSSEDQIRIKKKCRSLICIDDLHEQKFYADLIINHAPRVSKEDYRAQDYTQYALGPEFALLRSVFLEQAQKKRTIKKIETLFICFGGSDHKNLTESILETVLKSYEFRKIAVVTGAASKSYDKISFLSATNAQIEHYHDIGQNEILSLMLNAELAIIPASGILYEAISAKNIIITGTYAYNQWYFLKEFSKLEYVFSASDFTQAKVKESLDKALQLKNVNMPSYIDGKSGMRLCQLIEKL